MKLAKLFDDDRAVSPVIGVILMVAITVILAAVIGTFVLGLGDQVQQTTPRASFGFSQTADSPDSGIDPVTEVTATHESGDTISESDVQVTVEGNEALGVDYSGSNTTSELWASGGDVSAGSSVTVRAVYTGSGSGSETDLTYNSTGEINQSSFPDYRTLSKGDTIRVVYNSPDSDNTATLAKREVQ